MGIEMGLGGDSIQKKYFGNMTHPSEKAFHFLKLFAKKSVKLLGTNLFSNPPKSLQS